jgi:hypothetical protein
MEKRFLVATRHAEAMKGRKRVKVEMKWHMEDPEVVAATGGDPRATTSQPPCTASEKARLVNCVACKEFRPYDE